MSFGVVPSRCVTFCPSGRDVSLTVSIFPLPPVAVLSCAISCLSDFGAGLSRRVKSCLFDFGVGLSRRVKSCHSDFAAGLSRRVTSCHSDFGLWSSCCAISYPSDFDFGPSCHTILRHCEFDLGGWTCQVISCHSGFDRRSSFHAKTCYSGSAVGQQRTSGYDVDPQCLVEPHPRLALV